MKIREKFRKLQEKYENYMTERVPFAFSKLYMKFVHKDKEENKVGS
jgi:hypothetical protein